MRYVEEKLKQNEYDSTYRFFISEGIKILTKNTAGGEERNIMQYSYGEWLANKKIPEEKRTAEEIKKQIKEKLNTLGG